MPPRTRTTKNLKENAGFIEKSKHKTATKNGRPVRKVLADKTNSASDENTSFEVPKKVVKKPPSVSKIDVQCNDENRPRRERRLPGRFADNEVLKNLSTSTTENAVTPTKTNHKKQSGNNDPSPFKTTKQSESSLLASRPKRVCRLPTKFDDHSISPSKFIPVQPCHASTPIVQKKHRVNTNTSKATASKKLKESPKIAESKGSKINASKATPSKNVPESAPKNADNKKGNKKTSETNNNVEEIKPSKPRRAATKLMSKTSPAVVVKKATAKRVPQKISPEENIQISILNISSPKKDGPSLIKRLPSPRKNGQTEQNHTKNLPTPRKSCPRIAKKSPINFSFRMLETKKSSDRNKENEDVYEFTFDPKEEPAPKKKKKRVCAKKRPAIPRTVIIKNNYDKNLSMSLTALKDAVSKKTTQESTTNTQKHVIPQPNPTPVQQSAPLQKQKVLVQQKITTAIQPKANQKTVTSIQATKETEKPQQNVTSSENLTSKPVPQNLSIPISDIAADLDYTPQEINYSPTHFPEQNTSTAVNEGNFSRRDDPLNIIEELSFFDQPVASSSMISTRHPQASPWRVEFERLPIKWHINSYVKPNMTPAMECSFVNFDEGKKKHVYTNILPENEDPLPEIVQNDEPNLVQTSIISFIKEVVENSVKKKKRVRSKTPVSSAIFDEVSSTASKPIRILNTPRKSIDRSSVTPNLTPNQTPNEKDSSRSRKKRKNESDENVVPGKTPRKKTDSSYEETFYGFDVPAPINSKEKHSSKENTFFGFDESEDLENMSPKEKKKQNVHALRSRSRAILREINEQTGPTRALIPASAKTKANLDVVNQLYDKLKSAEEAPDVAEKNMQNPEVSTVTETSDNAVAEADEDDSQSVHLFEDIELVRQFKVQRKSYGKAKKVTFRQRSSDSETQIEGQRDDDGTSSEDDLHDLTFEIPAEEKKRKKSTRKKMIKKQKLSKKEEAEAEAWAAGFNSMCEDVEEFPLMVE